ncbi:MAG: alpha-amylase family glycosyl hydrolase [Alistipes sp.]
MEIARHPKWSYQAVIYEMNVRQLTPEGTLRAAIGRLDFLHDMGIDAVWLMPVYPIGEKNRKGSLGSYYSIRDYCAVNPEFGTMADFDAFVSRAHALGMKVLLDWVANHTARDARWLTEKPADWYERDAQGEALVPWDWNDTAKLNYENRAVWQGEAEAMQFWLTEHAIDGFRCDMAMLVPIEFWNETARQLRRVKPDLFMLAEAEEQNLFEQWAFDACYAWKLHHLMNDVARQTSRVTVLRDFLRADAERYPHTAMRLAFTSNHDENSWNGSEFTRMGAARELMTVFTFVAPRGIPLIYTGQEIGYDHRFQFFDRDPMPFAVANEFTALYGRLIRLKHTNRALAAGEQGGAVIELSNNAEDCLMTFVRETEDARVVAVMNFSPYSIQADFNTGVYAGIYTDALTGERVELPSHVERQMEAWTYQILTKKLF